VDLIFLNFCGKASLKVDVVPQLLYTTMPGLDYMTNYDDGWPAKRIQAAPYNLDSTPIYSEFARLGEWVHAMRCIRPIIKRVDSDRDERRRGSRQWYGNPGALTIMQSFTPPPIICFEHFRPQLLSLVRKSLPEP